MTITHSPRAAVQVSTERHEVTAGDPLSVYLALRQRYGSDQVYLLESPAGPAGDCRYAYVGFGELLSVSVTGKEVSVRGIPALRRLAGDRIDRVDGLEETLREVHRLVDGPQDADRFSFGFLAFLGYDAARHFERLPYLIDSDNPMPDACLVLHRGLVRFDLTGGGVELLLHRGRQWPDDPTDELVALLAGTADRPVPPPEPAVPPFSVSDDVKRPDYHDAVDRCLEHIAAGDIYQVQIGHQMTIHSDADPVEVYRRLRQRNPSPYMSMAPLADRTVISASPELFVRVEGGVATMRPIAGTAPRAADGTGDEAIGARLRSDPKEVAEHIMLVDLCRNDIGRICRPGTLRVTDTMSVEAYSHVLHLVSSVEGAVRDGMDSYAVLAALFPSGTMTGAPKIRAMEIIESMEHSRRGLYAGAFGLIGLGGYVNLALCIRSLVYDGGTYRARASAGVVADSKADREWRETLAKLSAAYWAVTGEDLLS